MTPANYLEIALGAIMAIFVSYAFQVLMRKDPPGVVRGGFGTYFRKLGASIAS